MMLKVRVPPSSTPFLSIRSLSLRDHPYKTALNKVKTKNNIFHKISGNGWGKDATILRTSALAEVLLSRIVKQRKH